MASTESKTIIVTEGDGEEVEYEFRSDGAYDRMLARQKIAYLKNDKGVAIFEVAGLEHNRKYRLGPSIAPPAEAKGSVTHEDLANLQTAFREEIQAIRMSGGKTKGVSTQAEFYRSMEMGDFNCPAPKKMKLEEYKFEAPLSAGASEEAVQEWMNKWIASLEKNASFQSMPMDGHKIVSYSNRKPDVPCHVAGKIKSETTIVLLGDVKKRRKGGAREDFTDEEKGHIFDFLQELLETQPFRENVRGVAFADGFLCDSHIIQFFRLIRTRVGDSFEWRGEQSEAMEVQKEGGRVLLALLESNPDQRGWKVPQVKIKGAPAGVSKLLGYGATGSVFRVSMDETNFVAKVFHSQTESAYAAELTALKAIHSSLEHLPANCRVTTLVCEADALDDERKVLILEPEGKPFACSAMEQQRAASPPFSSEGACLASSKHFCLLVDVLQFLHTYPKLGHRDVKLSNCFALGDTILLNDFGSSAPLGASTHFCGALQNAPFECMAAWAARAEYKVAASHDLEMVVRAIFQRISPQLYAVIQGEKRHDCLVNFWNKHTSGQPWKSMLQAARECDYSKLKLIIGELELA